jgi:ParB family chromosome partitioning protein
VNNNTKNNPKAGAKKAGLAMQGSMARLGNISDMLKRKDAAPSPALPVENPNPSSFRVDKIHPDPNQPRKDFEEEKLRELADSIGAHGVIQPITLQKHPTLAGEWIIVTGERRWRASKLAGLSEMPAVITTLTPEEVVAVQLIENIQREDLSSLEIADGYRKLQQEFSLTQEQVAQAVGKSKQTVSDYLKVLEMPVEFQRLLADQSVRGAGDLNALWRLNRQHPERVQALIAGASEESPITRVMIRAASSDAPKGDATGSPAGRTSGESNTEGDAAGSTGTTPPPADNEGSSDPARDNESGKAGEPSSTPPPPSTTTTTTVPNPQKAQQPAGTATSNELIYTISTAHKNGEWIATVRLAADRLFASEPVPTGAEAVAQAASWLRDHSGAPQ